MDFHRKAPMLAMNVTYRGKGREARKDLYYDSFCDRDLCALCGSRIFVLDYHFAKPLKETRKRHIHTFNSIDLRLIGGHEAGDRQGHRYAVIATA